MKSEEVKIEGITYKVSSSTEAGLKDAIVQLKKSLKPKKTKKKTEDNE